MIKIYYNSINMLKIVIRVLLIVLALSQYTVVKQDIGSTYIKLDLKYTGQGDYYVKPKSTIVKDLVFHFKALTYNQFTFKIYDPNYPRFELPQGGIFPEDSVANFSFPISVASYKINFTTNHFNFLIVRRSTQAILFDSSIVQLQFSDLYLQIGTVLDSKTLFGYSERFAPSFKLTPGNWAIFNADHPQIIDKGDPSNGLQTYGYYPAYLLREQQGSYHMGYMRTSNALEVEVESFSNKNYMQIFRVIGGIIDFRFIVGSANPQEVVQKFHSFIGPSHTPPFWSLGFHQSRWGYKNITALENVIKQFKDNGIPLDTIWSDIDYMHDFHTFTVDTDLFPLNRLRDILKSHQYVPIVEPCVQKQGFAYEQGIKKKIFIRGANGEYLNGKSWAGSVHVLDFFHPNATQYWKQMLDYLYKQVPYSGLWLDMNVPDNQCDGQCVPPTQQAVLDYSKDLPYTPGRNNIETATIPLNSTHYGRILQANVHSLFGLMEAYNTFQYLKETTRPFIITRSTTFGSNRFAFHWSGDNYANFTFLKNSIISNFMMGIWGIQMVGSDICGFGGNATVQVCSRFFQLGSLFPFSRDHNQFDAIDQQPYALGPIVLQSSKKNLKLRYSILKSYYREFIIRRGVGTIFRPLLFQFYNDQNILADSILETQFLIGDAIMAAPILQQGKNSRTAYFPESNWYNFHTGQVHPAKSLGLVESNLTDLVPLFIRDGRLFFQQNVTNVTKTSQLGDLFTLVGGFKKMSTKQDQVIYQATGGILSLFDYGDEDNIKKCLAEGCDYSLTVSLYVNSKGVMQKINIQYQYAGKTVKNRKLIDGFVMYTEDNIFEYIHSAPVEIYDSGNIVIDVK